jgi:hypothetical protein
MTINTNIVSNNISNDIHMNHTLSNTNTSFISKSTIISIMMLNFIFNINVL